MNTTKFLIATFLGAAFVAAPAFALQTATAVSANADLGSTSVSVTAQTKITTAKNRADEEIARRVGILTQLNTSVQAMVKVSAAEKTAIATEVQTEITNLTNLKTTIDAETAIANLKTDIESITKGYRIFMLVIPQGRIEVAADKIETVVSSYSTLSATLQTRISQAPAGTDTAQVNEWLSDMNTQAASANTKAEAAVSLIAALQPDQGDATVQASNSVALQSARADIKAALADLKTARQDAGSIVKAVESWKTNASVTATTTIK